MAKRKSKDPSSTGFKDLPVELIREILLRLSIKHLASLSCVSKLWQIIIYDHKFAKFHLKNSSFLTHRCISVQDFNARVKIMDPDSDSVFHRKARSATGSVSFPYCALRIHVVGSCNGLVCLHREPYLITIWNPTTGSYKAFSYYRHIVRNYYPLEKTWNTVKPFRVTLLSGFGYDESNDDYLVIAAWKDKEQENHFDYYSLRSNSWKSFDVALPNYTRRRDPGLFFNGAIHWLPEDINDDKILVFDITKRSFSEISKPKKEVTSYHAKMVVLRGCLALYSTMESNTHGNIWIMEEYKVHKSWTLYKNRKGFFRPLCFSSDGGLVGLSCDNRLIKAKANSRRELFYVKKGHYSDYLNYEHYKSIMYTQSLMPLSSDSEKNMKKKKRKGQQEENHNEFKQEKKKSTENVSTC